MNNLINFLPFNYQFKIKLYDLTTKQKETQNKKIKLINEKLMRFSIFLFEKKKSLQDSMCMCSIFFSL